MYFVPFSVLFLLSYATMLVNRYLKMIFLDAFKRYPSCFDDSPKALVVDFVALESVPSLIFWEEAWTSVF